MVRRLTLLCFAAALICIAMIAVVGATYSAAWLLLSGCAALAGVVLTAARWVFQG